MFYHPTWNVKIGLSRRGRFSLALFTTFSIKLSRLKKSWSFSKASLVSFSIRISHSGTSRSPSRLEPDFAFDFGGMSIAAITQAIASIPTNSPFVSFFLFIFLKFYWFVDGDRIVICSFFSRRKAEKVWWNRAVWLGGEDGLSRFTRNGDQIVFLSEAERNEEYRVCYFMFLSDDVAMLCSWSFAIIMFRKRGFFELHWRFWLRKAACGGREREK